MSVEATRAVWRYSLATGTARLILLAIADNADDAGIAWPSHKTLAEKCHVSRRAVIDNIDRLVKAQELGVVRRRNSGNVYLVTLPDVHDIHQKHHEQAGHKCRFCTLANVHPSATYVHPSVDISAAAAAHEPSEPPENHHSLESEASNQQNQTDPLVARMASVCTGRNVENEAEQVVSMLRQYVDDRVIDECVGIAAQLEDPPRRPRYFLTSVRDFATRRGVAMPNLRLAS